MTTKKKPATRKQLAVDLIIFDLDMTLVDSLAGIYNCLAAAFQANGVKPPERTQVDKLIGIPLERIVELLLLKAGINASAELNKAIVQAYREKYAAIGLPKVQLFPGVIDVLESFKEKRLAIISTMPSDLMRKLLSELDILKYFNILLGQNDVHHPKPSPEPIFRVLDETKVHADRAVIIGDTIYDIEAGKSAGIHTIAVTYGVDTIDELKLATPEFSINNIRDLMGILV